MISLKEQLQLEVPYSIHTNLSLSERASSNEFQRPVAVDLIPPGKVCDWCYQTAERKLTALGGRLHNMGGIFCSPCGEQFVKGIFHSSQLH
jgi:hypothetical protein